MRLKREERPPAGLDVFLVTLDDVTPWDALQALATPEERDRALRYRSAQHQRRYLARHVHLRRLLGERLQRPPETVRLIIGPHGKPTLEDAALGVSLSSSEDLALIAIGERLEVGCDIERIDPDFAWRDAAAADVLAPCEEALLASRSQPEARALFYEMWTLKEAALKCSGQGLSAPAQSVVSVGGEDRAAGDRAGGERVGGDGAGGAGMAAAVVRLDPAYAAAVAWAPPTRPGDPAPPPGAERAIVVVEAGCRAVVA